MSTRAADPDQLRELTVHQFAERFALNPNQHAWLLGAGASATAGIPTGQQMIRDFRKKLYVQVSGVNQREIDTGDPIWQERIDNQLACNTALPPKGDPSEYSRAFDALYPNPEDRRRYIANQVEKGTPSIGHRVLGALLSTGKTPCVFTTNFDSLIETGAIVAGQLLPADSRRNVVTAAIDNADRAERCLQEGDWPLVAKMHGDYQSIALKNTDRELAEQDTKMRSVLAQACQRFGLIVAGYSGRDASVMNALTEALASKPAFPGGICWLCRSTSDVAPAVQEFFSRALAAGVTVYAVRGGTFDEFASRLADVVDLPAELRNHIFGHGNKGLAPSAPLSRSAACRVPVLRLSAVPILKMPATARQLVLKDSIPTREAQRCVRDARIRASVSAYGRRLAAFGKDGELMLAFRHLDARIEGQVELDPARDSWALGLQYEALIRAVCRRKPLWPKLSARGHTIRVSKPKIDATMEEQQWRKKQLEGLAGAYGVSLVGKPPQIEAEYSEGVFLRLDYAVDRWWCVFEPSTFVEQVATDEGDSDDDASSWSALKSELEDWRRERWAQRYNSHWSQIVDAWIHMLFPSSGGDLSAYELNADQGVDAAFAFGTRTAWSRPLHDHPYFSMRQR